MDKELQENSSPDQNSCPEIEIIQELISSQMKICDDLHDFDHEEEKYEEIAENHDIEVEEDEEFSFMFVGLNTSPISAEDLFIDGKIKPVFPFYPPVDKVFVETNDDVTGPYSNRNAVEVSGPVQPDVCKKSNSTGFSKLWRFKEFMGRSNSDGRDAFVFLNAGHAPPAAAEEVVPAKVKKTKTSSLSAHEVYLRSKAKLGDEKRRSYLPYRPELMGFFTNVKGGLTKNVHPF